MTTTEQSQGVPLEPNLETTPRLRFTDENGQPYPKWEEKKLGEMGEWKSNSGFAKKHINSEGANSLILYGELYTKYDGKSHINKIDSRTSEISTRSVSPGDLLFPASGETKSQIIRCLTVSRKNDTPIYTSGDLLILSPSTEFIPYSLFMSSYINSPSLNRKMRTKAQGNSVVHMSKGTWGDCSIPLPSLPEQKKIGEFLSALDDEVEQAERLVSLLSDRKRAYAQSVFNRTLRFHDDNGNPYPEWEEKKLGDVSERVTRKNTLQEKRNLTISSTFGLVDQMEFFSKQIAAKDNSHYILLKNGEYAYNKSTSKDAPYGAVRRLERYSQGAVSTLYICFKTYSDYVDSSFFKHLSSSSSWLDGNIPKIATEGARNHGLLNIAPTDFFSLPIPLPSLPEQEKIGSFLSALDDEIDGAKRELELLKEQKKAYAQRIFGV